MTNNPIEIMHKYCDNCKYKGVCWRLCPVVQAAILFGDENVKRTDIHDVSLGWNFCPKCRSRLDGDGNDEG